MITYRCNDPGASLDHDYALEPPDEIIAELQSSVVQWRRRGECSRDELLGELAAAGRALAGNATPRRSMRVAALAVLLRMGDAE